MKRSYPFARNDMQLSNAVQLRAGSCFSKVPITFRKTQTRLFSRAGLFICCIGNQNEYNCKVSSLETPSFWRYKENYVIQNAPEKLRDFRETGPWPNWLYFWKMSSLHAHEQLFQFGRTDALNLRIDRSNSPPVLKNGRRPKSRDKVEHTLCQSGLNRVQLLASSRPCWKFPMVK